MSQKQNHSIVLLTDVRKSFGAVKAVDGVSLNIGRGEFFSLLGPSGCGKTTLLRLIAGFEKPESGQIIIDDKEMAFVEPNLRPTNMVFQSYAIFPHLNVEENVGYGLKRQKISKYKILEMVNEMLDLVGLNGFNKRSASALSGGQRQRVALARALILKPKVLLLDEPLSALDKKLREQMQIELRAIQRAIGITFILVTHDQEEALTMSDNIAVMFDGKVEQKASPRELYLKPISRRVASFIGNMNFLSGKIKSVSKLKVSVEIEALGKLSLHKSQFCNEPSIGSVELGIRPEMLVINKSITKKTFGSAEAKIVEISFFGDYIQYKIKLAGSNVDLIVSEMHSRDGVEWKLEDNVSVSWAEDSFVPFK
tara:strand:- start:4 stop:1104 length:1101 start_codon:yes stop_codon:yes gene_type:complete